MPWLCLSYVLSCTFQTPLPFPNSFCIFYHTTMEPWDHFFVVLSSHASAFFMFLSFVCPVCPARSTYSGCSDWPGVTGCSGWSSCSAFTVVLVVTWLKMFLLIYGTYNINQLRCTIIVNDHDNRNIDGWHTHISNRWRCSDIQHESVAVDSVTVTIDNWWHIHKSVAVHDHCQWTWQS